ncbi:MAG: hypothetical protein NTU98_07650 [Bacteroidetes bacterium]|nr:hypothetical protein [Bacteroidota bacterium]
MRNCSLSVIPVIFSLIFLFPATGLTQTRKPGVPEEPKSKKQLNREKMEEDRIARWDFGINFGTYFANKYTANYYNGSEGNVNNIGYVMTNQYWYEEIKHLLNASYKVQVEEVPTNMHYHVALTGGLFFRYNFTSNWGLLVDFNYAQLNTDGEFTVSIDTVTYLTEPNLQLFGVHGREQRVNFDLAAHRRFPVVKKKMNLFAQLGMNVNYCQVMKNYINIYDHEYSIVNIYGDQYYVPNTNMQENPNNQNGFGYGLYAGGGMGFIFSRQIGLEVGGYLHYITVGLEGYNEFRPSGSVYIRFVLNNLISKEEE